MVIYIYIICLVSIVVIWGIVSFLLVRSFSIPEEKEEKYREEMCGVCENTYQPFFADTTRCDYCGERFHTKCFTLHVEICPKLTKYREKEKELVDKGLL